MDQTKKKFVCPSCNKAYEKKFYFDKHVRGHAEGESSKGKGKGASTSGSQPATISDPAGSLLNPDSIQSNSHELDDEMPFFESEEVAEVCAAAELYFDVEDEEEEARRDGLTPSVEPPKEKCKSKKGRKAILKCSTCKTNYFTFDGYFKHMRVHAFSDILSHCPTVENIHAVSFTLVEEVLQEILEEQNGTRESAVMMKKACQEILEEKASEEFKVFVSVVTDELSECVKKKKDFSLPTDLKYAHLKCTANYMSSDRSAILELLEKLVVVPQRVLHLLLASLIRRYSMKVLTYILRCLNNKGLEFAQKLSETYAVTAQNTQDNDFKQNMHYIGGSNIKSVLRKAFRIQNPDSEWLRVISAVKKNFLVKDVSEMPAKELISWTESRDRGGLVKINNEALNFFVSLGCLVKPLEHFDGSLYVEEVFEKVINSPLMLLWDKLLKSDLNQGESLKLLYGLCLHFSNTWRAGIVSRRLDDLSYTTSQKHGTQGVAFRAKLAA